MSCQNTLNNLDLSIYAPICLFVCFFIYLFYLFTITNALIQISNWIVASGDDIVKIEVKKRRWCYSRLGAKWFGIQILFEASCSKDFQPSFRCPMHEKFCLIFKHRNWCKSRYEEQRVFIIFLFLFELGFIYSSILN